MSEFSGKVVLITGASSGIGAATAKAFAKQGACLSVTGRNKTNLNAVAEECKTLGAKNVFLIVAELRQEKEIERIMEETINKFGKLDILVNNAGTLAPTTVETVTTEVFDDLFAINLKSSVFMTQKAVPHLEKTKGNIVNVSSFGSKCHRLPFALIYTMTKAAMDKFTQTVALELAGKGIRVNSVNPAACNTNFFSVLNLPEKEMEKFKENEASLSPLEGRLIEASEVADAILFLASSSAKMITGSLLSVDGGRKLTGQ